jgi:GTP-binding protein HflX
LPHSLIASFKATLEEARQADLLLHVADASNPAALEQIASVYKVLEELGINQKDTILVLNQIDAIAEHVKLDRLKERYPSAVAVSARTGEGLNRLAVTVSDALTHHFLDVDIETDVANGRLLAALAKNGEILSRTYADDRVSVHCRMPRKFLGQIPSGEARIRLRTNGQEWPNDAEASTNGRPHTNGHTHTNGNGAA